MVKFFQQSFLEEQQLCEHKKIEKLSDSLGYSETCGEIFTDASDMNLVMTNCKHESTYIDDSKQRVCTMCGIEVETQISNKSGDGMVHLTIETHVTPAGVIAGDPNPKVSVRCLMLIVSISQL